MSVPPMDGSHKPGIPIDGSVLLKYEIRNEALMQSDSRTVQADF